MKYTFTCDQGHEPESFTVEAEDDEEAVQKLMEQSQGHVAEKHTEMASASPEEARQMIMSNWTKEDE